MVSKAVARRMIEETGLPIRISSEALDEVSVSLNTCIDVHAKQLAMFVSLHKDKGRITVDLLQEFLGEPKMREVEQVSQTVKLSIPETAFKRVMKAGVGAKYTISADTGYYFQVWEEEMMMKHFLSDAVKSALSAKRKTLMPEDVRKAAENAKRADESYEKSLMTASVNLGESKLKSPKKVTSPKKVSSPKKMVSPRRTKSPARAKSPARSPSRSKSPARSPSRSKSPGRAKSPTRTASPKRASSPKRK